MGLCYDQKVELVTTKCLVGLDRTGHTSFLTGQDWTPKFAGQVLPDRIQSGLIFLNILPYKQTKKSMKNCLKKKTFEIFLFFFIF